MNAAFDFGKVACADLVANAIKADEFAKDELLGIDRIVLQVIIEILKWTGCGLDISSATTCAIMISIIA